MTLDLLTPTQGTKGAGPKNVLLHAPFMWVTHTPNLVGLGGDSITDGRMDGGDYNIPFAFLKVWW